MECFSVQLQFGVTKFHASGEMLPILSYEVEKKCGSSNRTSATGFGAVFCHHTWYDVRCCLCPCCKWQWGSISTWMYCIVVILFLRGKQFGLFDVLVFFSHDILVLNIKILIFLFINYQQLRSTLSMLQVGQAPEKFPRKIDCCWQQSMPWPCRPSSSIHLSTAQYAQPSLAPWSRARA